MLFITFSSIDLTSLRVFFAFVAAAVLYLQFFVFFNMFPDVRVLNHLTVQQTPHIS